MQKDEAYDAVKKLLTNDWRPCSSTTLTNVNEANTAPIHRVVYLVSFVKIHSKGNYLHRIIKLKPAYVHLNFNEKLLDTTWQDAVVYTL